MKLFIRLVEAVEKIARERQEENEGLHRDIAYMEKRLNDHIAAKRHVSTARRKREAPAPILEQDKSLLDTR